MERVFIEASFSVTMTEGEQRLVLLRRQGRASPEARDPKAANAEDSALTLQDCGLDADDHSRRSVKGIARSRGYDPD
jgi:hypothetical protein